MFGSLLTAMITPFKEEEREIDFLLAEKMANHLIENGTDTIVVGSIVGESPTLSWDEVFELASVVQKAVSGRIKVIVDSGSNSTREAIAATRRAVELGLDGSLQVCPYYNKPSQEALFMHFRSISKACESMPILLRNAPLRTGVNINPETVGKLSTIENIVGIEDSSGSLDQVSAIRMLCPDFLIYSGDDSLTLPMMAVGGNGAVSTASHIVGLAIKEMIQEFEDTPKEVAKTHLQLFPLFRVLGLDSSPVLIKMALAELGWDVGYLREPLLPCGEIVAKQLQSILKKLELV
jgi:4-hydroxy-tetrahydrodipicolinate synthase